MTPDDLTALETNIPALCAEVRRSRAMLQAIRDLVTALPTCDQCDAPATHGRRDGCGKACAAHAGELHLPFPRHKPLARVMELLETRES